jgi:nitric oxide reductase NorD protein
MADRNEGRSPRIGRALREISERLGPASRILRQDVQLTRDWLRHRGALDQALGRAEARAYTRLVEQAAAQSIPSARILARLLPDHLAMVAPEHRARYLSLLRAVIRDRTEALELVIQTLPRLLQELDDESLALYLSQALELHSESPQKATSFLRMESVQGQEEASRLQTGVVLREVRRTLTLYARAHCGESVQVRASSGQAYTDGRHIYLPSRVTQFGDERDFLVYRILTARSAGFLEFGSLAVDLTELDGDFPEARPDELELERFHRSFLNPVIARDLFGLLEGARVEVRVREEYPGIARDMDRLGHEWRQEREAAEPKSGAERVLDALVSQVERGESSSEEMDPEERRIVDLGMELLGELLSSDGGVHDTLRLVQKLTPEIEALLVRVDEDELERLDGDENSAGAGGEASQAFRDVEAQLSSGRDGASSEQDVDPLTYHSRLGEEGGGDLRPEQMDADEREVELRARTLLDALREAGEELSLSDARDRARREGSSYEEMADFIDRTSGPAGPATGADSDPDEFDRRSRQSPLSQHAERSGETVRYREWDLDIDDYKPDWVGLNEYLLKPGGGAFVEQVRDEYGGLISQIRRAFEALRPESLHRLRGLQDGDEIDLDRAIAERIERRAGGVPSGRIYMRRERLERDVAVAFLVDMSSSTNEVVNDDTKRVMDVAKEALVLISEAVDAIGDSSAIWGFSGYGRDEVAFYIAKEFDEPLDDRIRERIGRISWKMENRDGAAIRHATARLSKHPARVRLLILLSDGKPLDCGCDHYQDRYAQEDTRMALMEARRAGIHPFCITVDPRGSQYLAHMYGQDSFTVIDCVELLPTRLPQVYRRLTR